MYPCRLKQLSPTGFMTFQNRPDAFVLRYVLQKKSDPQTNAMAIGSAFDARIKSYLADVLLGRKGWFEELFENQVESHVRTWALGESEKAFQQYKDCGALANLMLEVTGFQGEPRFEFDVYKTLMFSDAFEVPLFGKPDMYFHSRTGVNVVLDWKVNGYCSQASPAVGFVRLMSAKGEPLGCHKGCVPFQHKGFTINFAGAMKEDWMLQLAMYQWMIPAVTVGETIQEHEDSWVGAIDQLVYGTLFRCASHRIRIDHLYKKELREKLRRAWAAITTGHYYADLPREESDARMDLMVNDAGFRFAVERDQPKWF